MNLYPRSFANSDEILPIDENKKHFLTSLERILEIILLTFEVKVTSICLREKQQWWSKSAPSGFSLSSQPVEKLLEQGMQQRVFTEINKSALLPADYHYFASCPIYQGNTIIGLLVLLDEKERKLSELQVKALNLFVEQIKEIIFCQIQSISLEEVEESFKQVLDTSSEYIILANPDTTITYANRAFCRLAGLPENEIVGQRWLNMMDAEKASLIATQIQQLSPKKSYFIFETTEKYQPDEKTANHIQWLNQGIFDKTGNLIQLKFVGRDTQYLRKTIDWLEENQRKLNNVLNTMINGVVVVDVLGKITYVNQQVAKIFSTKIEELKGTIFSFKNWKQINEEGEELPDNQFPLVIALQKQISVENVEIGVISPTQELKWVSVNASPLYDEYHRLIGAMASFIDITDKKNTQRHLQQVQKRLETITSTIEGVVWESDAQTFLFTYVSPQAKKMLGYDPEEWFVENFWANHIHPDDRDFAVEFCRSSTKQLKNHDFEYRFRKKDGNYIWLRDIVTVVAENNEPRWLRGIMVDITHQKQNQELLQKANEELSVTEEELRVSLAETLQMQKKLQETENLFRTALEASLEATYILKTKYNERGDIEDFVFQEVNYKTCQLLGLSRDELIGFGICELFPIHIELGYFERYKNVFLSQKPEEGEYYIPFLYKKSGWYYRQILPIPDGIVISSRNIDERKNLKEQLLTTSRMAKVGGWEFDLIKGEFLLSDISKEILEIENGFTLKIQSFVDFFKEGIDRERIMQALQKATIEGIPFEAEFRIATRKNETEKWVRVQAQPEVVYGRCVRLLGMLQDVDDLKKMQEKIQEHETFLANLIDNLPGYVYRVHNDKNYTPIFISHQVEDVTGYSLKEYFVDKTTSCGQEVHPDDREKVWNTIQEAVQQQKGYHCEFRIVTKQQEVKWVWEKGRGVFDKQGNLLFLEGFVLDITKEKTAQLEKEHLLDKLEKITSNLPVVVYQFVASPDGQITCLFIGKQVERMIGLKVKDIQENFSVFLKSILQEDVAAFHEKLMMSARQHTPLHAEFRVIHESRKRIVWLETHASTYLLGDGNVVLYGYLSNITEKKNLEKRLSLLSMVAKRTSNAVIITDAKRRITWVNEGFTRITGYTFADVVGKKPSEVVQTSETSPQTIALMREKLNNQEEIRCEVLNRRKDGTTYWVFIEIQPLFNEKGELTGYAAIETDITERKKMTDDLEHLLKITQNQNQRLREYAYITSHNIRSPLSSMMGLCELLKEEPTNATYLEMLDTSVKRLDFVVRKMNELLNIENNSQNLPRELINLKKAVEDNCQMLKNLMDETGIELILNVPEELNVTVIPAYLDSILNNLISNAIKYRTRSSKPFIEISANKSENFIVLSVKDNGLGIDLEKYGNKLFKMNSRFHLQIDGKGIGLFLTKHQIEAMGGKITVESKPNSGSIFNVWFYEAS